jgi:GNAT superfamily N-acetyltransferase
MSQQSTIELYNNDDHFQTLWDEIINPQHFYPEEVYYELTGERCGWFCHHTWEAKPPEAKLHYLESNFGELEKPTNNIKQYKIIIREEGKAVAFACWKWDITLVVDLRFIVVKETHHRKGYGKVMMDYFLRWCEENYMHKAQLNYRSHHDETGLFYTSMGFNKPQPKRDGYECVGIGQCQYQKMELHFTQPDILLSLTELFCVQSF